PGCLRMVRSHHLLPFVVAAAIAWPAAVAAAAPGFDRAAWQGDYAALKRALERDYANLAWAGSPQGGADLPALDRQARRALAGAENDGQAEQAIRSFVAGFRDGHLSFLPRLEPDPGAAEVAATGPSPAELAAFDA